MSWYFQKTMDHRTASIQHRIGLGFRVAVLEGYITKASLGSSQIEPNPTDRGKSRTNRHLLTEAAELPISVVVTGANCHDKTQVKHAFEAMSIRPPYPAPEAPQHFCGDKGYDYNDARSFIGYRHLNNHIKIRGQEHQAVKAPGYRTHHFGL
jgi:hypothetical protein